MQIQTLTITTETQTTSDNSSFKITTFEQTTTAFCDCCPNQSTGTKRQLENSGWFLGRNEEFCPDCN
jgi:hypothetical protein